MEKSPKSIFVIWIDREHAKLFQFSEQKMERKDISATHNGHHTPRLDQAFFLR